MVDPTPENHSSSERGDPQDHPEDASGDSAGVKDGSVFTVDWDGPEDPSNPKNWPLKKKWAVTTVVSLYTFMTPLSSSAMAPASDIIAAKFGVTNSTLSALLTSIFVLGYVTGPMCLGPLSEVFGRARVLQAANFWYLAWNFGCAFAQNTGEMLAFRFLSGFGGSGCLSIGGGVLGDVWKPEQRGQAVAVYSLMPLLGPVVGPICGAWIAQLGDYRWVFWAPTIVSVAVQLGGWFFLEETFPPVLLERKADNMKRQMDTEKVAYKVVRTIYDGADRELGNMVRKALLRPFMLFFKEPIIQVMVLYMSFVYGCLYLFLTTLPSIFQEVHRESIGIAGLNYISLGIGMFVTAQANARFIDTLYKHLSQRNGGIGKPEYRLPAMVPGTFLLPIGLFITGWTARADVHWIAPNIGILIVGAGMVMNFQTIQTYIIDSFTLYTASALAAVTFFRSLAGFGFPLFAPPMFNALGYGKGDTILACVSIAIGIPAPFLFWKYGERLRNASRYAKHT